MSNSFVYQFTKWDVDICYKLWEFVNEVSPYGYRTTFKTNVPITDQTLNDIVPYGMLKLIHALHGDSDKLFGMYRASSNSFEDDEQCTVHSFSNPETFVPLWTQIELSDEMFALNFMLHVPPEIRQYMVKLRG